MSKNVTYLISFNKSNNINNSNTSIKDQKFKCVVNIILIIDSYWHNNKSTLTNSKIHLIFLYYLLWSWN